MSQVEQWFGIVGEVGKEELPMTKQWEEVEEVERRGIVQCLGRGSDDRLSGRDIPPSSTRDSDAARLATLRPYKMSLRTVPPSSSSFVSKVYNDPKSYRSSFSQT